MKKRILCTLVIITAIVGGYYFAMYQIGNKIIDEAIDQQLAQLQLLEQQLAESDPIVGNNPSVILSEVKNPETPTPNPTVGNSPRVVPNATEPNPNAPVPDPIVGNVPRGVPQAPAPNPNTSTPDPNTITASQLEAAKSKITANDKVSIANLVLKKLTSADIQELTNMLSGGLTPEEKKRAKQIAYSRFTQDEISAIYELYTKYVQ